MTKKVYDSEFKQTIVSLYDTGKTVAELCSEYTVSPASVNRWKKQFSSSETSKFKEATQESKRIKALEKELKAIKLERDILKKAVGIFSKSDK